MNKWLLTTLIAVGVIFLIWGCVYAFTSHVPDTTTYTCKFGDLTYQCPLNIEVASKEVEYVTKNYDSKYEIDEEFSWDDPRATLIWDSDAGELSRIYSDALIINDGIPEIYPCANFTLDGCNATVIHKNSGSGTCYYLYIYESSNKIWIFETSNYKFLRIFENSVKINKGSYNGSS